MGDDGIATPRNLEDNKNQAGSGGILPEGKRSMDGVMTAKQIADSKELLQNAQSATQSQQFKTMDNSSKQLHEDTHHQMSLKNNLQTSHSGKVDAAEESKGVIDTKNLNSSKESESVIPITNEVIEEQDEHDEEERKNNTAPAPALVEQKKSSAAVVSSQPT